MVAALASLRDAGSCTLIFEQGEYHFWEDGAEPMEYAVCNNAMGVRQVVFSLRSMNGITVDGGGSRFVIHGKAFPFACDGCKDLTIRNVYFDRGVSPHVQMKIQNVTSDGFDLEIDRTASPFRVEDGSLIFAREWGEFSGKERRLTLFGSDRIRTRYLFTGNCADSCQDLPVDFMWTDAEEIPCGARMTYRSVAGASPCLYEEGEIVFAVPDGDRETSLLFFNDCEGVRIENVALRQALGMGIIAQACHTITVKKFCTDYDESVGGATTTVDAMHFVGCDGFLEISDCRITHPCDDALNVHGVYTKLQALTQNTLRVTLMHKEQRGFCPYRKGDALRLIDENTLNVIGSFTVSEITWKGTQWDTLLLHGTLEGHAKKIAAIPSVLVENPNRCPDLYLHHNEFYRYPYIRLSGGGRMRIEDNRMEYSKGALYLYDLSKFWYESGRIRDLTVRRNRFVRCAALGRSDDFISIGVSGFDAADAPKIHERIEISDNDFEGLDGYAVVAGGVQNLILENNRCEGHSNFPFLIDNSKKP